MAAVVERDLAEAIGALEERYTFRDPEAVRAHLTANAGFPPLLLEVAERVPSYFGAGTPLALELFTDYEGDGHQDLVGLIRTTLPWEQAFDQFDRLGEDWWYEASQEFNGRLLLDVKAG